MPDKKPLKVKELIKKLKFYGVVVMEKRGKGSELILLKPLKKGSKKGPQYPIKCHGMGDEVKIPVINAILRRFGIDNFWE